MTNTIPNVPRELLELVLNAGWGSETVNALDDLRDFLESAPLPADHVEDVRAMVAKPSPAGVDGLDGLEVVQAVAWLNTATKEATTHPVVVMDWDDEKEPVESLMPISQHEAILYGLRGEVERSKQFAAGHVLTNERISAQLHAAEAERDQLAGMLRDVRKGVHWQIMADRIDAALSSGKDSGQ